MEETAGYLQDGLHAASVSVFLDRLFNPVFSLYVFTTIFLPSGSLHGVNVKYPLYLLLLPLALRRFLRKRPINIAMLAMMLALPALLSFWLLEGLVYGFRVSGAVRQYTDFVLTFLMCWLVFLFCQEREAGRLRFLRLILNCEIATCFFKAGIILYAYEHGVTVFSVVTDVSIAFGGGLTTMDVDAAFGRIQFVSDALIPVCIFIVLRYRDRLHIGTLRALVTIFLLLLSVLYSFSRYFWAYAVVAFAIGLLLGRRDRFKGVLIALLALVVLASLPMLSILYQARFSNEVAGSSDDLRVGQSEALHAFFLDAPILGHGLGSYTTKLIRSDESRQSYEMQLLALAGQTGIVGITFFLLLLAWYYRRILLNGYLSTPDRLGIGILLIVWLAAGLYNPLLEGAVASLSYASLASMSALSTVSPKQVVGNEAEGAF